MNSHERGKINESKISHEYLKSLFEYRDGELYWKISKGRSKAGSRAGWIHTNKNTDRQYRAIKIDGIEFQESRIIWNLHHGKWPEHDIDHIDGEPLNNLIENLRDVTKSENQKNRKTPSNNTSGITGVCPLNGKWKAEIRENGNHYYLGHHDSKEEAAEVRKCAEEILGFHENHGRKV